MRALQVLLSGWEEKPNKNQHLSKSLISGTADSFCSMLAYFQIEEEFQGHKFSLCDLIHKIEPQV